jgi:hypothetical protein
VQVEDPVSAVKNVLAAAALAALACFLSACPSPDDSPVISVEGPDAAAIADGGSYGFGSVAVGSTADAVFTVRNTGKAALDLSGSSAVQVTGSGSERFSVYAKPDSSVPAGGSTTFTIRFAPEAAGESTAAVSISNNDADLSFTITGTGTVSSYPDTDADGAPDYLEQVLGTSVTDPDDNPASRGYHVAILPKGGAPSPAALSFTYAPAVSTVDVLILLDSTASMVSPLSTLQGSFSYTIAPQLGSMGKDAAVGICTYRDFPDIDNGYGYASDYPFQLHHRILTVRGSSGVSSLQAKLDALSVAGGADNPESSWEALYQAAVGSGTTNDGASVPAWNAGTAYPTTTPSGEAVGTLAGVGFRSHALPCIVWITDAVGHNSSLYSYPYSGFTSPTASQAVAALVNASCRVIGIDYGGEAESKADMLYAVKGTGARVPEAEITSGEANDFGMTLDGGTYPLLYTTDYSSTGLAMAVVSGVQHLAASGAFNAGLSAVDDASDAVDAPAAFIRRLAAVPAGGQAATDTNADTFVDRYTGLGVGESAAFSVVLKQNGTVSQKASAQVFAADLHLYGGTVELGTQKIYFVVPPIQP